ncbi:14.7 kDa ribonuclease H-like protein [compost metagenome]
MIEIWTDATSRPKKISRKKQSKVGDSAIAVIIKKNGNLINKYSEYVGILDNNQAEYTAFIEAVKFAIDMNEDQIVFYTDSNLLEKQMNFKYSCRAESITKYYLKAKESLIYLKNWKIVLIPRKENREADRLAHLAMENWIKKQKDI